jgi:hypothetical protein
MGPNDGDVSGTGRSIVERGILLNREAYGFLNPCSRAIARTDVLGGNNMLANME